MKCNEDRQRSNVAHKIELTDGRVVFNPQVDMLLQSEAEISGGGEVLSAQLVFFHF